MFNLHAPLLYMYLMIQCDYTHIQAQRLLLKDGSLAHFTLPPNPTAMPNITAGLPAQVSNDTF